MVRRPLLNAGSTRLTAEHEWDVDPRNRLDLEAEGGDSLVNLERMCQMYRADVMTAHHPAKLLPPTRLSPRAQPRRNGVKFKEFRGCKKSILRHPVPPRIVRERAFERELGT